MNQYHLWVLGDAIQKACAHDYDSEALLMAEVEKIVHRDAETVKQKFLGTFDVDCQKNSIPASLLALVEMIIKGPSKMQSGQMEEDKKIRASQNSYYTILASKGKEKNIAKKKNALYRYALHLKSVVRHEREL